MVTAKCTRCLGSATGSTFTEASAKINHAVGLSRGIKCGDNYNQVHEVKPPVPKESSIKIETPPKTETPKESSIKIETPPKESPVVTKPKSKKK